ncbi:MAG: ATP-grasp domain-containing protein [Candidatus Hodarchaeales archaeon]|jgi:predicted ATP-grasp superfamily ATP-dependent carboligase
MPSTNVRNRKILVAAVNARPLVESVLASQQQVAGCVDYFGDCDIVNTMKGKAPLFSVIKQEKGELNTRDLKKSLSEVLFSLVKIMVEEVDFDYIIPGSGFRPSEWRNLEKIGPILGCDAFTVEKVRNRETLYHLCNDTCESVKTPSIKLINDKKTLKEVITNECDRKMVIKPSMAEGGLNTLLLEPSSTFVEKNKIYDTLLPLLPCHALEYLDGMVFSTSVISTGDQAGILSYNLQLSGLKLVNSPGPFTYSGNIVPLITEKEILDSISSKKNSIEELAATLGLKGTIGFDFIVDRNSNIFLLEVNPRVQGTLEPLELSSGLNIIDIVLDSFECESLPDWEPNNFNKAAIKLVLYSPLRTVAVPLKGLFPVKDIPFPGTIVEQAHPFCTYIEEKPLISHREILDGAYEQVERIYRNLRV